MNFKPTYLYIKQHSKTGLLYFGKTTQNPETYNGSGKYWNKHINKHGKEFIETLWYCLFLTPEDCNNFAIAFSKQEFITESSLWANLKDENGLEGGSNKGVKHRPHSEQTKQNISKAKLGKPIGPMSEEHKAKIAEKATGRTHTLETKAKLGKPKTNEHLQKISESLKGRIIPEETRRKMSESRKGKKRGPYKKTLLKNN